MPAPTVTEMLKYANLQMAAEALYEFNAKVDGNLTPGDPLSSAGHFNKAFTTGILTDGNQYFSKFSATEAAKFVGEWTVLDHLSNTTTGFSGTLFKNGTTNELVLSLRSTEFVDDAVRDGLGTNALEVSTHGWAFGQIADMEAWYKQLKKPGGHLDGQHYAVTGYSLGGHLATAFNQLRTEDGTRGNVDRVVTFNGAGVGEINNGGSLTNAIRFFNDLRDSSSLITQQFSHAELGAVYELLRGRLADGHAPEASVSAKTSRLRSTGKLAQNPKTFPSANDRSWQRAA